MTRNRRGMGLRYLVLSAGALASTAALAAEPQTTEQVTVQAERPTANVVGRTSSGIPVTQYELRYLVSYADLDLATSAGVDALKKRISEAAKSACKDLDNLYPIARPDTSCARAAEEGAMSQVNTVIAAARDKAKTG